MNTIFRSMFIVVIYCSFAGSYNAHFNQLWYEMQEIYFKFSKEFDFHSDREIRHPYWEKTSKSIISFLGGKPNEQFLFFWDIQNAMVRFDQGSIQEYEKLFLTYCLSNKTRAIINNIEDTDFGHLPRVISEFNCSSSTLGHLYYAARLIEMVQKSPETIVEIGGGYGNLARIMKQAYPNATYIIIDLPEMLALQWLFLKGSTPLATIECHMNTNFNTNDGAIHLVPTQLIDELHIDADLFVSTLALSECPLKTQEQVIAKKFFNAQSCYIVGQINGWKNLSFSDTHNNQRSLSFVDHTILLQGIYAIYPRIRCQLYHTFLGDCQAYDITADLN